MALPLVPQDRRAISPPHSPNARLSLWLKKTETIIALPLSAASVLSELDESAQAQQVAERLGTEFVAALIKANAVEILHDGYIRLIPGSYLVQVEDGQDNRLSRPHELMIELTSRCNFACPYCCLGTLPTGGSKFDISPKLLDNIMTQLQCAPVFRLIITGGEPLLWETRHKALFPGVRAIRRSGTYTTLFTNGVLLDRFHMDVIDSFDKIVVSLDAVTANEFKEMSGRSGRELERVKQNVAELASVANVQINAVANKHSASAILAVISWAVTTGVRSINVTREFALGNAQTSQTALSDQEWHDTCDRIRNLKSQDVSQDVIAMAFISRKQQEATQFPYGPCKVGRAYMVVNYDGTVSPCIGYKSDLKGSVEPSGLDDVWRNGDWSAYRSVSASCPVPKQEKVIITFKD